MPGGSGRQAAPSPLTREVRRCPSEGWGHPRSGVGWCGCHRCCFSSTATPHMSAKRRPWEASAPRAGLRLLSFLFEQISFLKKGPACGKVHVTLGASSAVSLAGSPSGRMAELVLSSRTRNEPILHFTNVAEGVWAWGGELVWVYDCDITWRSKLDTRVTHKRSPEMKFPR